MPEFLYSIPQVGVINERERQIMGAFFRHYGLQAVQKKLVVLPGRRIGSPNFTEAVERMDDELRALNAAISKIGIERFSQFGENDSEIAIEDHHRWFNFNLATIGALGEAYLISSGLVPNRARLIPNHDYVRRVGILSTGKNFDETIFADLRFTKDGFYFKSKEGHFSFPDVVRVLPNIDGSMSVTDAFKISARAYGQSVLKSAEEFSRLWTNPKSRLLMQTALGLEKGIEDPARVFIPESPPTNLICLRPVLPLHREPVVDLYKNIYTANLSSTVLLSVFILKILVGEIPEQSKWMDYFQPIR